MKRNAKKRKNVNKRMQRQTIMRRGMMGLFLFCGTLTVSSLTFMSLELAGLALGFFAFALVFMFERARRKNWENASSFKAMCMDEKLEDLTDNVARNKQSIYGLQRNVTELSSAPISRRGHELNVIEASSMPDLGVDDDNDGHSYEIPSASTFVANDDPFADHASLSDMVVQELVRNAVRNKRIDVFVQPVMRLPQRQPIGFEIFARIRAKAGLYVPAGRYMDMARAEKISGDIDNLLLTECLKVLKSRAETLDDTLFFINIEPNSLKNSNYMRGLLNFVSKNRDLSKKLVFELRYQDYMTLPAPIMQVMNGLTKLGCIFSLDHVDDTEFNLQDLIKNNVRYMKMQSSWMIAQSHSDMDFTNLWRIKNKLESNGVRVIVDHIEKETTLRELLDFDPHYGQGFLFGKPDLMGAYPPFSYTKQTIKRKGTEEKFG